MFLFVQVSAQGSSGDMCIVKVPRIGLAESARWSIFASTRVPSFVTTVAASLFPSHSADGTVKSIGSLNMWTMSMSIPWTPPCAEISPEAVRLPLNETRSARGPFASICASTDFPSPAAFRRQSRGGSG